MIKTIAIALAVVASAVAQTTPDEAKTLAAYPLTMDHVSRHFQVLIDFVIPMTSDETVKREFQNWSSVSLEQQIHMLEANKVTSAIVKAHGITARDHVMTSASLNAVMIAWPAIDSGKAPDDGVKLQYAASSPQHVKFLRDHDVEIRKLGKQVTDAATAAMK